MSAYYLIYGRKEEMNRADIEKILDEVFAKVFGDKW